MAGATREGGYQCQPWRCAARGCSAGVPPVDESFPAGVPSHCWNGAAQVAIVASHRACQGEAARWPIAAIGCGLGVRLRRSEPPHASLHPIGWHKSGRVASVARRIAGRDSRRFRRLCQDTKTAPSPLPSAGDRCATFACIHVTHALRRMKCREPSPTSGQSGTSLHSSQLGIIREIPDNGP